MNTDNLRRNVAVHRHLHPVIPRIMLASVAWSVVALWVLFDDRATLLSLGVVTVFALAYCVVPLVLWRASPHPPVDRPSLKNWLEGEFETDRSVIDARDALVMTVLIPIASAVGLTAVSFVAWLAGRGVL